MTLLKLIIKKLISKFSFKIWKVYVCKKEIIDFVMQKPIFKESEIKKFVLFTLESPNPSSLIAADPFIHDANTILYESISKQTGNGNIYKYDILNNKNILICLPENKHYSFPRTIKIKEEFFFTCESAENKGLTIFKTNKDIDFLIEAPKSNFSEDLDFHIIDPIISIFKNEINLYCTSLEEGNYLLLVFKSEYSDLINFKLIKKIKLSKKLKVNFTLRLAGLLSINNKEYLATQNHNESYGSSLNLIDLNNEDLEKINIINEFNIFSSIDCKDLLGPHTINKSKDSTIIVMDLAKLSLTYFPVKVRHFFSKYLKKII